MGYSNLNKAIARIIALQRIELASPTLKRLRKIFGRYLFTNFVSKYFISASKINLKYHSLMNEEYDLLKKHIEFDNKEILSIGSGMCGLELIINSKSSNPFFTIIEKNYISKKVIYGWDIENKEGYNDLKLLRDFLNKNGMQNSFEIFDYDKDHLPSKKFDLIISLYSMDYHYDFSFYEKYIKQVSTENTKIIFDTIRPDYFKKVFQNVEIIDSKQKEIHSSKRVLCNKFLD